MREIAADLYLLGGKPRNFFNVYLMSDVLVDSGTRYAARRILREVGKAPPSALALTHGHADHQGSAHEVCTTLGIPLLCGTADQRAVESGDIRSLVPPHWSSAVSAKLWAGPGHPVERVLRDGDEIGGFRVIDTPGHSPGHISFFRDEDKVLILGDVVFGLNLVTGRPGLRLPPDLFTPDPEMNRNSARAVAALEPSLVCFGHGRPLGTEEFVSFVKGI